MRFTPEIAREIITPLCQLPDSFRASGQKMAEAARRPIRLLIVDDDSQLRETFARWFQRSGMHVIQAETIEQALRRTADAPRDLAILDLHLPDGTGIDLLKKLKELQPEIEVLMLTGQGSIQTAIEAMRAGAYDYLMKPVNFADLDAHLEKAFEKVQLARHERQWLQQIEFESPRYRLVGSSPVMQKLRQLLGKIASSDATVLIRGASGTGKELVARAVHYNSPRRSRPLVTINCAALQETLLESELFGHEKGAFTGALQAKAGLIEVAEGGTLFVDEIAEMAPGLQAKLLRVLEDGHYRRVGSTRENHVDVRVVAATNKPLEEEIKAGKFREDLIYRLNVVTVNLPLLRDRRQDIPELVEHFLSTRQVGPARYRVEPEALDLLAGYSWPGNVRELANVLERAQILAEDNLITVDDLPETMLAAPQSDDAHASELNLSQLERRYLTTALHENQGNKSLAANALGISRRALYRLIAKYGLDETQEKDVPEARA
jgi:DNA-binding NtrC family response regulator